MKTKKVGKNEKKPTRTRKHTPAQKQRRGAYTKQAAKRGARQSFVLVKPPENPIITPRPEHLWEAWQTFNPGVVLLEDKVYFLYRAVGDDGISRFGYAASDDGFVIGERLPSPVYTHTLTSAVPNFYSFSSGGSFGGCEDPRIVRVGKEERLYMTYTACDDGLRVALASIPVRDFLQKKWKWSRPKIISPPGEVHKNWVLFPEKIGGKYAILHSLSPEVSVAFLDDLEFHNNTYITSHYNGEIRRKDCWDNWVRGVGAPPIRTAHGWLLFYHAIEDEDPGKYKVGAMLLDLHDPTKVICRSARPVLEPDTSYETNGFKGGVVYVSGAVVKNEELLVYYGAADSFIGVAHAPLNNFLKTLMTTARPQLRSTRRLFKK